MSELFVFKESASEKELGWLVGLGENCMSSSSNCWALDIEKGGPSYLH